MTLLGKAAPAPPDFNIFKCRSKNGMTMKKNRRLAAFFALSVFACSQAGAQVFWSEHFNQNGLPAGWQTSDPSGNQKLWTRCVESAACLPGNLVFQSATATDGFAFVRSSGSGPLPSNHLSRLTSPRINCSDKQEVLLEFEAYIITFNLHAASGARVKVRAGNSDWKVYLPFCHQQDQPRREKSSKNPERIRLDISEVAAFQNNVQIEWEWEGNDEVFWCLDDVRLLDENLFYKDAVWGREPGQGDFNGDLNGWTVNAITNPAKSWVWDSTGDVLKARSVGLTQFPFPYIESYSSCNGTASFNSDFYSTGGTNPIAPPYPMYEGELISPVIDLSGVSTEASLQFTQLARLLNPHLSYEAQTNFAYSTDNGRTWSELKDVNEGVPQGEWSNSTRTFPLPGAAGNSKVKIKFVYAGDLYFWVLDDVLIVRRKRNDLELKNNFYAIAPNALTPASQVELFGFTCDFENLGTATQSNTVLSAFIVDAGDGEVLFRDTILFSQIAKDELIQNQLFTGVFEPENSVRKMRGIYLIGSDSLDQNPANNEINWFFEVTDSVFAKETGFTKSVIPARTPPSFHYGNCFFAPNGENFAAAAITFGITNSSELRDKDLNIHLFEWAGDENGDQLANPAEYSLVATQIYRIKGNEGAVSGGMITVPLSDLEGNPVFLKNQKYYIASVEYSTSLNVPCELMFSDEFDYKATWFVSNELGRPTYGGMEDFDLNGNFDIFGFGLESVPVIRLHISKHAVKTEEITPGIAGEIRLGPNPARSVLRVDFDFEKMPAHSELKLLDVNGTTVLRKQIFGDLQDGGVQLNLSGLPKGFYTVRLENAAGIFQKKLLIR